ncbi:receptor-like protein 9b isoform X2 [Diospyros lotus]|uniref:receptor-like protein 9b isoform X2 n=1 Tax=Diospyros lotus TaxID=55363 RepID=UPI00224DCBE3|nr:receptor-like protein 9b isoform X2 [Diospyros lotus]
MYTFVKNAGSTTPHPWLKMITMIVLVLVNGMCCHGCWEQERIALLHLKASINDPSGTSLPSWVDNRNANCCQWEAVECSNNSKRVVKISLTGTWDWRLGNYEWHFNASLFLPFEELKALNLSGNGLVGWVDNEGFKRFSMLINVEVLDLSENQFNDTILEFVGEISSLRSLSLALNWMEASIDLNSFGRLSRLSNLELLDISYNSLNSSTILTSIGGISSLKFLDLSYNDIGGSIDINGLCQLKTLQELNIRGNEHLGTLPWCLANLTSLRFLDISSNYFNGNIAFSPLVNLTTLKYLALSNNQFDVPVSFKSFLNHSKLKVLESLNNKLVVERECHSSTPSFQLAIIRLSDTESSNCSVGFPHFLYHQNELQVIELSQIDFNGKWPNWLLENNSRLVSLVMPDNSLHGPILQLPLNPITGLSILDISNNHIEGYIPYKLASIFPRLVYLNMSTNGLKGDIPSSLGDLTSLKYLDLSNNRLSGKIPVNLAKACESLRLLSLSNNYLTGPILPPQTNSSTINFLLLDNNHFTQIPDSLLINSLVVLNVGHNQLAGKINPGWIWNQWWSLWVLSLSNNNFEGPIPIEFCELHNLIVLDLSNNYFTGIVPSCFSNLSDVEFVWLSNNRLSGPFPEGFHNSSGLTILDLSNNRFSKDIPKWIGNLSQMQKLLLNNNSFEGNIPNQVCHLSMLTVINLSWNNFIGDIPHCLHTIEDESGNDGEIFTSIDKKLTSSLDDFKTVAKTAQFRYKLEYDHMEFTTKGISLYYKGVPLDLFSAIDLSNNKLTGCIPPGIGNLSHIKSLNLSHNNLTGPIPATFSNLENIESLDLSYNSLQGNIPYKLTGLHYLAKFNVSYNNLSGRIPQGPNQFQTFDGSSYIGNSLLCGEEVANGCNSPPPIASPNNGSEVEFGFIDMGTFYMSFAGSYLTVLLVIAGILYINPHWRRVWFHFIEVFIASCYYFVMGNLWKFKAKFLHKRSPI